MRTVRWNHTSKKLFLFIISLLVIIPAFTITAIATNETTASSIKPYLPGFSIFSAIVKNNTTKDGSGGIAPLGGSDDPVVSGNPEIKSISDTSDDDNNNPSTPDTDQPGTPTTADPIDAKIQRYETALSTCAAEIKPLLSLKCSDGVAAGSMFKVLVTSDGTPVEKALVSFINQNVLTDKNGAAYLQAPKVSEDLKIPITASKDGYGSYTTYVHIIATHAEIKNVTPSADLMGDSSSQGDYSTLLSQPQMSFQQLFKNLP
jgi:hypothetical protein